MYIQKYSIPEIYAIELFVMFLLIFVYILLLQYKTSKRMVLFVYKKSIYSHNLYILFKRLNRFFGS